MEEDTLIVFNCINFYYFSVFMINFIRFKIILCFLLLFFLHIMFRGMAGVILYSDPADDGDIRGTPYPEGHWR